VTPKKEGVKETEDETRVCYHPDYQLSNGTPFREQHLIENLSVHAYDPHHQVLFYTMLN
jgi:hypothetical protein